MVKRSRRSRQSKRSLRGGHVNISSPGSAWKYELDTVGGLDTQIRNAGGLNGNEIRPIHGGNQPYLSSNLAKVMGGGSKSKKGGMWGAIYQAIVPVSLLGLQQSVRRKHKTSRRHKTFRRH